MNDISKLHKEANKIFNYLSKKERNTLKTVINKAHTIGVLYGLEQGQKIMEGAFKSSETN